MGSFSAPATERDLGIAGGRVRRPAGARVFVGQIHRGRGELAREIAPQQDPLTGGAKGRGIGHSASQHSRRVDAAARRQRAGKRPARPASRRVNSPRESADESGGRSAPGGGPHADRLEEPRRGMGAGMVRHGGIGRDLPLDGRRGPDPLHTAPRSGAARAPRRRPIASEGAGSTGHPDLRRSQHARRPESAPPPAGSSPRGRWPADPVSSAKAR